MSDSDNAFEKIDKALDLYYRSLGRYDYYNNDKIGKFIEFCDDNGLDVDDIDEELDDPQTCMYIEFDEDFPFIDGEKNYSVDDKNGIIFQVIKSGYQTGLPPDKYRPRKKNLTRPVTISLLVESYLHDIVIKYNLRNIDGTELIIPKVILELCTKFELLSYNLMAPYDFKINISQSTIVECETIFANLYMYHSKLASKSDYFSLAIGYANKYYPWLFYVLESFDRDRIRRGTIAEPEKREISLKEWMVECDFINEYILQELGLKELFESIEKVCIFYIRKWKNQMRVLPSKMEMERMYILDDLYEIVDVVIGIYKFIKWLVQQYPNNTKFSCEFAIGIHSTKKKILTTAMIPDMHDKEKQAAANKAEQDKYKHIDKVGDFVLNMRENKVPYAHREVKDRKKYCEVFQDAWSDFKFTIEAKTFPERASTFGDLKTNEQIKKYYSPFPKQRRFCCFIDRREYYHRTTFHKQLRPMMMGGRMGGRHGGMMDMGGMGGLFGMMGMYEWARKDTKMYRKRHNDNDEITFFIPDDQYLPINDGSTPKNGIYPESYMDLSHQSMIPELRVYDDQKEDKHLVTDRISGITSLSGGMFNLLFQIERYDEIRMYLHWHNQCIRLHPQDFWLVLPRIFVKDYKNNSKFANDLKIREHIKKNFQMPDKYFEYFYKYMSVYNQQPKEWIDKPTQVKYVN